MGQEVCLADMSRRTGLEFTFKSSAQEPAIATLKKKVDAELGEAFEVIMENSPH